MNSKRRGLGLMKWLPSRRWLFLPPLAIAIGVVAWLVSEKKELPRTKAEAKLHVNVLRMERTEAFAEATGFGTAQALRTWTATAEVGGRVEETHSILRNGIAVAPNELLLSIDAEDYLLRLKQRRAEVAQAQAKLDQIKLQAKADDEALEIQTQLLGVRKNEVSRIEKLRNGLASSEAELDSAKASWLLQAQSVQNLRSNIATYGAQIASAEASLSIAESNLKSAERDLERTQIRAPFQGILTGVSLEESQYVAPNQQLFQVIDNAAIEITAQFSLAQLRDLVEKPYRTNSRAPETLNSQKSFVSSNRRGIESTSLEATKNWLQRLEASVVVRSGNVEASFPARVERVTGTVDEQTRTLGIVVKVDNENTSLPFALTPGTYCEIKLQAERPTLAHIVPRDSLDGDSVLVVDENKKLARRKVNVVFSKTETVAVSGGLNDGDLLVLNPSAMMREGKSVEAQVRNNGISTVVNTGDCNSEGEGCNSQIESYEPSTGASQ